MTTDFGLKDPYVAEIKATILRISPGATIVDVTHDIAQFNILMGAYTLSAAAPHFPEGTIHVAVVDPGVGTRRRSILIQTADNFFIGPDNGLLILAAEQQGIKCIREITNKRLMLRQVSSTFHGRDVFASAAAHLSNGAAPAEFGPEIRDVLKPEFLKVALIEGVLVGEVLHVDNFGNVTTNIRSEELTHIRVTGRVNCEFPSQKIRLKFCKAYGEAKPHDPLILIGSHNYLEIAINQGNAAEKFKVKLGDKIKIFFA